MTAKPEGAATTRSPAVIALHWLTLLLLLAAALSILARAAIEDLVWRQRLLLWHRELGMSLIALTLLRAAARYAARPWPQAGTPRWTRKAVVAAHLSLYALLIALPMSGWVARNGLGLPMSWFGFALPDLIAKQDVDLIGVWIARHRNLAWTMLALVCVHVGAAFWHHYVRRDGILLAMLPDLRAGRD